MNLPSARVKLCCAVRGCGSILRGVNSALACEHGHAFDVARSGYTNLLQPQDRRSKHPGDSRVAVLARRRLIQQGHGAALLKALIETAASVLPPTRACVFDAGCGEGSWLAELASQFDIEAWGADISVEAVDRAARAHKNARWIVSNVDRTLPFEDGAFDCIVSVHARVNPAEFARVLAPSGALIVVLPGPDDLGELRLLVQGRADERDRVEKLVLDLAPLFQLERRTDVRESRRVGAEELLDLLETTYRGGRGRPERIAGLEHLDVTSSHAIAVFRHSRAPAREAP